MNEFVITPQTRAQHAPGGGMFNISMDYNAAPGGARGTEVIIPDNATPAMRLAADRYNASVAAFAAQYGIPDYPIRGVRTRSENGRGVGNTIHTEPFFSSDAAMQQAVRDNPAQFAELYRSAFGSLPNSRLVAPHGVGADRGALSDFFTDETTFGELMANTLLGNPFDMPAMGSSGGARLSTRGAPTGGILSEGNQMAQPQQGLLSSLGIQRRDPNAQGETAQPFYNRRSFGDTMARIAPALGRMGVMGLEGPAQAALDARNERQGDERARALQEQQRNQTIEWLVNNGREDLAGAVQSGGLPISEAMSIAMTPAATSSSFEGLRQQALAGGLVEGTRAYQEYILNGGGDPENVRGLQIQAELAGLVPGTPEFENFILTRGSGDQAYAARSGKLTADTELGADAAAAGEFGRAYADAIANAKLALPRAIASASLIDGQISALLADPNLDRMLGPVAGRLPNTSAEAISVQARIDQISGQAFLQAREVLKGSGTLTDYESNRAEAAYARMNQAQSPEDFRAALIEFNDMVQRGMEKIRYQSERTVESYNVGATPPPAGATPASPAPSAPDGAGSPIADIAAATNRAGLQAVLDQYPTAADVPPEVRAAIRSRAAELGGN